MLSTKEEKTSVRSEKERTNIDIKTSFTAADSIPLKVLLDKEVVHSSQTYNRLPPVHIQFLPTNRCNLRCTFCSCSERNKQLEMEFERAVQIIDKCRETGTRAVTVTGGGEPLLYSRFDDLIDHFWNSGIRIGLVTNGLQLHKANMLSLNRITWCRISNGDERNFGEDYRAMLSRIVHNSPLVDWAFSHVVSGNPNLEEIARVIDFANEHNFTHVRLVSDLFQPESIDMSVIMEYLHGQGIDDSLVVYQERKSYTKGGDCYIGFLKPLIGPDAKVYACCGVQYALKTPSKDLPEELCLGNAVDIDKIMKRSDTPLDGSICEKCYYMNYNILLKGLLKEVVHKEFV